MNAQAKFVFMIIKREFNAMFTIIKYQYKVAMAFNVITNIISVN
jgi:hypothetical protein